MKSYTIIDNESGEIITEDFKVDTLEDTKRKRKFVKNDRLENEFKDMQSEYFGEFVYFIFNNLDTLSQKLNDSELVKFIYLGTFVKPDRALKLDNNKTYITKTMLTKILNISSTNSNKFYNTLVEKKLIKETEKGIFVNPNFFFKGSNEEYKKYTKKNLKDFARLYIESTRLLYEETNYRNHSKLAVVYKLIPFCNWKYNILCKNPDEAKRDKLEVITVEEAIKLIGYGKGNHIKKFVNDLTILEVEGYNIFLRIGKDYKVKNDIIVINPLVYYRGNDIEELQYLIDLFHICTKDYRRLK